MRQWKRLRSLAILPLVLFLSASATLAQTAQVGTLAGEVKDQSGALLPGVSVVAQNQEKGFSRTEVTDAQGRFRFPVMPPGVYSITATLGGFQPVTLPNNLVETERTTNVAVGLSIESVSTEVTVTGEAPIVDATNTVVQSRMRSEDYQKLPIGRSYLTVIGQAPGVVGTTNVNSHGALTADNQYLMDGVDTTDTTTGTFGSNLNYESIQEVSVYTSGVSAEYGRAVGAIVNVVTKSGTNKPEGGFKYIFSNDDWNAQNTATNQVNGASLERVKFDQINPVYSLFGGGPIWKDHAWFYGTYEKQENTTPRTQTPGQVVEEYQQTTESPFWTVRFTGQLASNHNVWVKFTDSPTNGFVNNYWGAATPSAELFALTFQDQGADHWATQYSGVLGNSWTAEAMFASYSSFIDVYPFSNSPLDNGAPHFNQADNKYYNGATFDGRVERPRKQAILAASYYRTLGGNAHNFKFGYDWQGLESSNDFRYPNNQLFTDLAFNQVTRQVTPFGRQDFDSGASTSSGDIHAFYVRDKFEVGRRLFFEAGFRFERQTGSSDIGTTTVDTNTLSPRLSGSYDIAGTGKSLIVGSYGRFYQSIIQTFSDEFSAVPQQANYNNYRWDGTQYVFTGRVEVGGSGFDPNLDLKPTHVNEATIGFQQQLGRNMGAGVRYIHRTWGNLIDDVLTFDADDNIVRTVQNYEPAERSYRGVEFTFERRLSNNWFTSASYTYAKTEGNHFATVFSALGDFVNERCITTVDPGIGTNGIVPCGDVNDGPRAFGLPANDRPHNVKLSGTYTRRFGRVGLTGGAVAQAVSKATTSKQRQVTVLFPGTTISSGQPYTYFYESRGADRIDGTLYTFDASFEATFYTVRDIQVGFKSEIFELFNPQKQGAINNTAWCESTASAACQTARANYGTATVRASFQNPRSYRFSAIVRF